MEIDIEHHPLAPFLPNGTRLLILGSFPPPQGRWSMDFFYPNYINDMWRIMGEVFFNNKGYFVDTANKTFHKEPITDFLEDKKIGIFDSAVTVKRQKGNASDKFLEVVTPVDLSQIIKQVPNCQYIVTTGQKASEIVSVLTFSDQPAVGGKTEFVFEGRELTHYRMPSTSRAYPKSLDEKAEIYRKLFIETAILK